MTSDDQTIRVLNHLLAIHHRSLPVYLQSARPWTLRQGEPALEALHAIAQAHHKMVERIAGLIIELDGVIHYGEFPHRFADWHDLSLSFLLQRAIECQERDIVRIEKCVQWLEASPRGRALAEEALGEAKAHLETLQDLAGQPTAA
jgi:hypothetical protein